MNRKFITAVSLMLVLMLSFSVPVAYAYGQGEKAESYHHKKDISEIFFHTAHFIYKNQEKLGLSDEQVKRVENLKIEMKKDLIKRKAEIELLAVDIKAKLWEDTIDAMAINKLIDQKYELKNAKAKALVNAYAELKNILTAEQRKTLKSLCLTSQ